MKLELLDIRTLPGIHPGFRIEEFSPGVNFITGPNASGKSSSIRALRYLLTAPSTGDPANLNLLARFENDDHAWQVQRIASHIQWEIDGQPCERPDLPSGPNLRSHLITIEDLFRLESDNERELADQLRRELHQGYDLTVLRDGRYQIQPRIGYTEQRTLRQTRDELLEVEANQREVSEQEKRLPMLAEKIDQARAADRESRHLQTALELIKAQREQAELETRLDGLPDNMERLQGNETRRLDELEQRAEALDASLKKQREAEHKAREALEASSLVEGQPEAAELDQQQGNLGRLEHVEQQLRETRQQLDSAELRVSDVSRRLQLENAETDQPPQPGPDELREAQGLAEQLETHQARHRQLEQQIEDAEATIDEADIDRHQRAIHALQDWLSTPATSQPRAKWPTALAAVGAVATLAAGMAGIGWLAIGGAVVVLVSIALPWLGRQRSGESPHERAQDQLRAQRIEGPIEWSRDTVQQRLSELERRLAALHLAQERQKRAGELRSEVKRIETELNKLQEQRHELARRLGFDPRLTTRAMAQFLRDLEAFHQARLDRTQAQERVNRLESQRGQLLANIQALLSDWMEAEAAQPEHADALAASLSRLQERCRQAHDARSEIRHAEDEISRLQGEIEDTNDTITELYQDIGLETDQRRALEDRLSQLEEWRELQQRKRRALDDAAIKREELRGRPDLLERAEADDADSLEEDLAEARDRADSLGDLREEKGSIEAQVDQTGRDRAREKALAALSMAEDELESIRAQILDAELAHFLLDEIEDRHRKESEPPLLERAGEAFRAFTHNAWDLEFIEKDRIGFQARDLALAERRSLGELSTATRMQLLLALRLGQIQLQEGDGHSLPLIIDEALTTSDHERASVIMRNLQELADEQSRQIIYLATGDYEHRLWERATKQAPHLIDLGRIRKLSSDAETPHFELPQPPEVPVPQGRSASEYARLLGVPAIDPRDEAGSVHVFHLLHDELELLHTLLQRWRVETLGQLKSLLQSGLARRAVPDDTHREKLASRCRLTRDWISAWRIGRGKPVDRGVLEQADGITNNMIDRISDKANDVDHDPRALMRSLEAGEVSHYRDRQREALKVYLLVHGYLPDREPLTAEERRQRVLTRMSDAENPESTHEHLDWLNAAVAEDSVTQRTLDAESDSEQT